MSESSVARVWAVTLGIAAGVIAWAGGAPWWVCGLCALLMAGGIVFGGER